MGKSINSSNVSVLIPDGEMEFTLRYVVTCLCEVPNLTVIVITSKKITDMNYSRHIQKTIFNPDQKNDRKWAEFVRNTVLDLDIDVLMPIHEYGIRTTSMFLDQFRTVTNVVPLPSVKIFDQVNNKWKLSKLLIDAGLPGIRSHLCAPGKANIFHTEPLEYPVIVKPVSDTCRGKGVRLARNPAELVTILESRQNNRDYVIQEFIAGEDIGFNVLCKNGKILAYTCKRDTIVAANEFAPRDGMEFFNDPDLVELMSRTLKAIEWSGVANIDLRFEKSSGQYKIIEINPRYWSSLQGSLLMGVNFPQLEVITALGQEFEAPQYRYGKYLSLRGAGPAILKGKLFFDKRYRGYATPLKSVLLDPMPTVVRLLNFLKARISR